MVRAIPWIDECDTDLRGTVGGVIIETDRDEYGNPIGPGVYIVFPDEAAAQTRFDEQRAQAEEGFEGIRAEVTEIDLAGTLGSRFANQTAPTPGSSSDRLSSSALAIVSSQVIPPSGRL
ncbi:MAG: hypothetical protein AVDCRST_MAG87-3194 [uncultured Thermomicrobiales bacterium]|uniref:Uncharacterized protein n=1 Tax=uncultured Thermomicrobiales bacterium TaxID=1645740 RepID=A0A6J4VJX1_9BACT|nr:MAG: hypothetical protein AVDCRST_MAG87-3194 [uncultured Thermomicrobiales bacterium]